MSNWLLAITALIYLGVALDYFLAGKYGMCVAFLAYSTANVGFILANRGT